MDSDDIFYLPSDDDDSSTDEEIKNTKNKLGSPSINPVDNSVFQADSKNANSNPNKLSSTNNINSTVNNRNGVQMNPDATMQQAHSKKTHNSPATSQTKKNEGTPIIGDIDDFKCSPEKIDELRSQIETQANIYQNKLDEIKAKHEEQLTTLRLNNQSKEQSLLNENDLNYRNLLWTVTLKYLGRGCFTEDLEDLFQRSLSDKQYEFEKDLIELKQQNEEELTQFRLSLPAMESLKRKPKKKTSHLIFTPKEMAEIIYNKYFLQIQNADSSSSLDDRINNLIEKLHNESTFLSTIEFKNLLVPPYFNIDYSPKRKKSTILPQKSKYFEQNVRDRKIIQNHKETFKGFEKTMKSADKYIQRIQMKPVYGEMFPHFDPS